MSRLPPVFTAGGTAIGMWGDQSNRSIIPPLLAYSESTGETRRTRALLGMINYMRDPNGNTFELQPLVKTRSGKVAHVSILWRLFERHQDANESYYRFLFLPHKFGRTETRAQP